MTIPALMQSTQNQETVARVKKFYSVATQAFARSESDNGAATGWGWDVGPQNVLNVLAPYLNITKNCGTSTGCWPDVEYKYISTGYEYNYNENSSEAKAQLADGTLISINTRDSSCSSNRGTTPALSHVCGWLEFDVNGSNGPNQWGKDLFGFYITLYGVIPVGTPLETVWTPTDCDKTSGNGYSCGAWILQKGNMDYLN